MLGESLTYQSDTPSNVGIGLSKGLCKRSYGQRDGKEIKSIPGPGDKGNEEEHPLLSVEHSQQGDWVGSLVHRRLESGEASGSIAGDAHVFWVGRLVVSRLNGRELRLLGIVLNVTLVV